MGLRGHSPLRVRNNHSFPRLQGSLCVNDPLVLQVNGTDCPFTQELRNNDQVTIRRGQ